jgi:hypothetical protein
VSVWIIIGQASRSVKAVLQSTSGLASSQGMCLHVLLQMWLGMGHRKSLGAHEQQCLLHTGVM